jgi:hypothetical protein
MVDPEQEKFNKENFFDKEKLREEEQGKQEIKKESIEEKKELIEKGEQEQTGEESEIREKSYGENKEFEGSIEENREKRKQEVESILQEGLEDVYADLEEEKKQIFREKGEAISAEINEHLDRSKPKPNKIIRFIKQWLYLLNFNKEFVEQEAKTKTDKIINMNLREE